MDVPRRASRWLACPRMTQSGHCCFYYFLMAIVVIRYETKTAARRALTFIVRIFVNDTIAITVWTSFYFHVAARVGGSRPACSCSPSDRPIQGVPWPDCLFIDIGCIQVMVEDEHVCFWG